MEYILPIMLVAIVAAFFVSRIIKRKREQAMAAFATTQNWTAVGATEVTLGQYLPSYLRNLGDQNSYDMAYQATINNKQILFFQYSYTTHDTSYNSSTNSNQTTSHTSTFTILYTTLSRSYPNILLLHHSILSKLASLLNHPGMDHIDLEGDFSKHYDTYISHGEQIDSLVLLAPDVMQQLEDSLGNASLQFNATAMIASIETSTLTPASITPLLQGILAVVNKIEDSLTPKAA